jgi:ABC-type lipoprotein release transport system permease subunit
MPERLYDSLARQRFSSSTLGAFAAFAMLSAVEGLYGVMSYLVTQSTHDIGVLVTLGARPPDIIGLVVRQGMEWAAILGSTTRTVVNDCAQSKEQSCNFP